MRKLQIIMLVVIAGCGRQPEEATQFVSVQTEVVPRPVDIQQPQLGVVERQIVGSWRSESIEGDFPVWMTSSYRANGIVVTKFYAGRRGRIYHYTDQTTSQHWRVRDGYVEVGTQTPDGEFQVEGVPRAITFDDNFKVQAIDSSVRMAGGTAHPEYTAIRVGDG